MSTQRRTWSVISIIGLILVTMACTLPWATPQAGGPTATVTPMLVTLSSPAGVTTLTPGLLAGGGNGGNSVGSNGGGTGGNSGGGSSGSNGGNNGGNGENVISTPTELHTTEGGPYVVKQIETLGGEVISGFVCSLTRPFNVLSTTPHVTFTFVFVPQDAQHGNFSYAYSIPKAGESHDAAGTYTISPVDKAGTLQLSLSGSDHVVFKGFDGKMPARYKFNLVPSGDSPCPNAP